MAVDVHTITATAHTATANTAIDVLYIVTADGGVIISFDEMQGLWTEEQYLRLTDYCRRLIEFTDGSIEVLPMPTRKHQAILRFLFRALDSLMQQLGGTVFFAALRMQIREGKYREPDLLLLLDEEDPRSQDPYWLGADLVMEIVSKDNPERDIVVKRGDYAEARIPEYWIVNPEDETIVVLKLEGAKYVEHGVFHRGEAASSALLKGFTVSVDAVFDAR